MVESFGAQYVSLHVRVSNEAAIHLYRETLGFDTEKTEAKYYADGEDAFCMKLDLGFIRDQIRAEEEEEEDEEEVGEDGEKKKKTKAREAGSEGVDEGEPVGDVGKAEKENKKKVKVGRALGVGELVERDETKA